jgi:hypothetical protein
MQSAESGHVVLLAARAQFEMIGWIVFMEKVQDERSRETILSVSGTKPDGFLPYNG